MPSTEPKTERSLWLAEAADPEPSPPLAGATTAEVAVLGGGIVGVTAAHLLAAQGADVVLVEAGRIGQGTTGNTTAKLSSLHGLKYASLTRHMGVDAARAYGQLSERGIARVRGLAETLGIDCDLRARDNYTHTVDDGDLDDIEKEVDAARKLGLPAGFADDIGLPFPVAGAVRFTGQAEFQPQKYLLGLAAAAREAGARIHEGTRAVGISEGEPVTVRCETGEIRADRVIVATHLPFTDRGLFFARTSPMSSYAIAVQVPEPPRAMYLSTGSEPQSIRAAPSREGELLILGGEGHKTGQGNPPESFRRLAAMARDIWGAGEPLHRWSSHDPVSADGVPLIGGMRPGSDRVLTATGFSKWGLAAGTEGAATLAAACSGQPDDIARAFDPWRRARGFAVSVPEVTKAGVDFSARFVLDRVRPPGGEEPEPGSGAVLGRTPHQVAVYRDEQGERHELSARCTHLGCIVRWNDAEKSWDCPCHGSRFGPLGEVIDGPAVHRLEPVKRRRA